jgi:hypothetical protein
VAVLGLLTVPETSTAHEPAEEWNSRPVNILLLPGEVPLQVTVTVAALATVTFPIKIVSVYRLLVPSEWVTGVQVTLVLLSADAKTVPFANCWTPTKTRLPTADGVNENVLEEPGAVFGFMLPTAVQVMT